MKRYLSCLRPQEIAVLQGPPLLGAMLALHAATPDRLRAVALLTAGNVCLMAHVFLVNDWSNLHTDLNDANKARDVFTAKGVSRRGLAGLALALLAAGLLLLVPLGADTIGLAALVALLSTLYSVPPFNWKGRPLLNSVAHLSGGVVHFLMGYSLGPRLDLRGALVAGFVALTFAAGHLTQEVRDYDGDARNGIRTNAVVLGKHRAFTASIALFFGSYGLLFLMATLHVLPRGCGWLAGFVAVQTWWSVQAAREGLTFSAVSRLQTRYRLVYAAIGLVVSVAAWAP